MTRVRGPSESPRPGSEAGLPIRKTPAEIGWSSTPAIVTPPGRSAGSPARPRPSARKAAKTRKGFLMLFASHDLAAAAPVQHRHVVALILLLPEIARRPMLRQRGEVEPVDRHPDHRRRPVGARVGG